VTKLIQLLSVLTALFYGVAEAKGLYWLAYSDGTLHSFNTATQIAQVVAKIDNVQGQAQYEPVARNLYFVMTEPLISRSVSVVDPLSRTVEVKFPGFDQVIIPRSSKVEFVTIRLLKNPRF
jgi:hypothetical protein